MLGGMRLFASVRPPDEVLDHLEAALASVRPGPPAGPRAGRAGLRWSPPADRHVTVAFFGDVPEGYLEDLASALGALAAGVQPFDASLSGAGVFDRRTLWIGCTGDGWAGLMTGAGAVGEQVAGRPGDGRHRPHLTVARVRADAGRRDGRRVTERSRGLGGRRGEAGASGPVPAAGARSTDPAVLAHALALYRGPVWTVREIELVASELGAGPGGSARHEVVRRFALGAVAG